MNEELARKALNIIEPSSPLWSFYPHVLALCAQKLSQQEFAKHVLSVIDLHRDEEIKPFHIEGVLPTLKALGRDSVFASYYDKLISEFPNSEWTRTVRNQYSPEGKIRAGRLVPDFSVPDLVDSTKTYSRKSLLGSVYLLDFWATWCFPCVQEMGTLHKAFETFNSKGFVILSVSMDLAKESILLFRREKWPMPWMHTFVAAGSESELARSFEVMTIPKPILVNTEGRIIATGEMLRGERLLSTLHSIFLPN